MNVTQMTNAALVDELGALSAQKAEIAKREKAVKAALSARMDRRNDNAMEGELFRVTVSVSHPQTLDTKRLKEELDDEFLQQFMKRTSRTTFRVTARVANAAA